MTVIACKDGVMAADTSSWHGGIQRGRATKIIRLRDGTLMGAAGWKSVIAKAVPWVEAGFLDDGRPISVEEDEFDSIIIKRDRSVWCMGANFAPYLSDSGVEVVGSHHEFLYGAMFAGASAEEAVRLAIRHCAKAAGDVQVEHL